MTEGPQNLLRGGYLLVLLFSCRLRRDALAGSNEQSQQSGERAKNEMKRSE
jgi:hypothetical protein